MITIERWSKFSFAEQIGHVGSEISRARHWNEKNEPFSRENALIRSIELIDLTITAQSGKRSLKEIVRLREVICDWLFEKKEYDVSLSSLQKYCEAFYLSVQLKKTNSSVN